MSLGTTSAMARAKDDLRTGDSLSSLGSIESLVVAESDNSDLQLAASITVRLESVEASFTTSSQVVKDTGHTAYELSKQSSVALEKVSEHLKHLAAPSTNLAVQSANRSEALTDRRKTSFLPPRGFMKPSTVYDKDLGEVFELSGHATWADAYLCEIIQDLVDALSPLQTMLKGHRNRLLLLVYLPWKSLFRIFGSVCEYWEEDFLAFKRARTSGID